MIYEYPPPDANIRQGDIFLNMPRITLSLSSLAVVRENEELEAVPWNEVVTEEREVTATVGVMPVMAIVASQDCDAQRKNAVMLCEIKDMENIHPSIERKTTLKTKVEELQTQLRKSHWWFYLPPDKQAGILNRMGVDFGSTISVSRDDLENMRHFRKARLNAVAYEHFRERLSFFFHRYAYNEWYPLSRDEVQFYTSVLQESDLYPWQK